MELLYIYSVLHGEALENGGLVELLTGAEFLHDTGLLVLTLELLQSSLNVLTFFYGYYNQCLFFWFFNWLNVCAMKNAAQNYTYFLN